MTTATSCCGRSGVRLHTRPALTCPEIPQANLRHSLAGAEKPRGDGLVPYRACGERLEREAGDLSALNSAENGLKREPVNFNRPYVCPAIELAERGPRDRGKRTERRTQER